MTRQIAIYLMAAILLSLAATASATTIEKIADPAQFRNSLHTDYSIEKPGTVNSLPVILPQTEKLAADMDFGDLTISETPPTANFLQQNAAIASVGAGKMVAAWEDYRLGTGSIFVQLFLNDGAPDGNNVSLIFDENSDLAEPKVCDGGNGTFYVVWRNNASGFLQAARFDSLAGSLSPVFFISDTLIVSYAGEYDVACMSDGKLVVVWENYAIGNDIAMRLFNTDGTPATATLTVNSDGPFDKHWSPAVAIGASDDIGVAWEDYRTGTADIFFRRFDNTGSPYAAEVSTSDLATKSSARYMPTLAFSATDGYLAAWVDMIDDQDIVMQRLSAAGGKNGSNVLLSATTSDLGNWEVDLDVATDNHFLAAWTVYGADNMIYFQDFAADAAPNGDPAEVYNPGQGQRFDPSIAGNATGNNGLVWTETILGKSDIMAATLAGDGSIVAPASKVNDDASGSPSFDPAVTYFSQYEWDVVFTDQRRDGGDIMLQRIYVAGDLVDANRIINADVAGAVQSQPAVTSGNEKLCISWTDNRSAPGINGQNIFCRFAKPHYDLSDEIIVNDDPASAVAHYESDCAMHTNGKALVVWTDTRSGAAQIYGQFYNDDFSASGGNFLIGPSEPANTGEMASVSADSAGVFVVAYLNRLATGGAAVEVKLVNQNGSKIDAFSFASDKVGYQIDGFKTAVDAVGSVYIVWRGYNYGGNDLFLTIFDRTGNILQATTAITDDAGADPGNFDFSIDPEGYMLITWMDSRTGHPTPFRQIFNPALMPVGTNVPAYASEAPLMRTPVTSGYRGRGIFAWADARANGLNVYAAQEMYSTTDTDDDPTPLPTALDLKQNSPNPFNPTTKISFSMPQSGEVSLEVFNLLGQKVRTLVAGTLTAGSHDVIWDGTTDNGNSVASGMYFYRLIYNGESRSRKMMLMK